VTELVTAAEAIQGFIEAHGWRFCFIGGFAAIRWGHIRATQDLDVTVYTGFRDEQQVIDAFVSSFSSRIENPDAFAQEHRVLLLLTPDGIPVDVSLGGLPFEESMIERSSPFAFLPGIALRTCSAEDLIVMKAFASRAIDWADIEGIAVKQGSLLDWDLIMREISPLAVWKENPEMIIRLQEIRLQSVAA
jgi:hypothetical protein